MDYIDLGKSLETGPVAPTKTKNKKSYPTLYINGVKGLDFPDGEFELMAKARLISKTKNMKTGEYSCDIEILGINPECCSEDEDEQGLDSALSKIEKKKMGMEEEDED